MVGPVAAGHGEGRKTSRDLAAIEDRVIDPPRLCRGDGRLEELRHAVARRDLARAGDDQDPVLAQQRQAGPGFQRFPDLVRALGERRVLRTLAAGQARDAGVAVRRALLVRRMELVEPEHRGAADRELVAGRRAHRAQAENDDVMARHRLAGLRFGPTRHAESPRRSCCHPEPQRRISPNDQTRAAWLA